MSQNNKNGNIFSYIKSTRPTISSSKNNINNASTSKKQSLTDNGQFHMLDI